MPVISEIVIDSLPFDGTAVSVVRSGIGLGTVIAVVCSWQRNRSLVWAIIAGLLSWLYVVYFAITRRSEETRG